MKVRDVLARLAGDGWRLTAQKGSHRQFTHRTKPGKVTVNGKPGDEVPTWLLRSIFRQADWPWAERA